MAKKETTVKKEKNEKATESKFSFAPMPKNTCTDEKCPFHGKLKVHGAVITGTVRSSKASKTVSVSYTYPAYLPKYERYEKKYTLVKAHNPTCIDAKEGDVVRVMETRPLSKTKNFVVIEKVN